ncbi:hypothetical protein ACN0IV_12865 [Trabulsiella odontotermitis]|uniref:hypothetical protein n=1 Tax=Trabulsiella odontotermitis TaxID=379893 RepID=UPI003AD4C356
MIKVKEVVVKVPEIEETTPFVCAVDINGDVIGYVAENRDWNKGEKPISLVGTNGSNLGDFCCITHAVIHLTKQFTGADYAEVIETRHNSEQRFTEFPPELLMAMLAMASLKGKRPH